MNDWAQKMTPLKRRQGYKAFVSSTAKDLNEFRTHAIKQLRLSEFVVDPVEDWPADNNVPCQLSVQRLDGCHLCVLLVARRRGHVPHGSPRSITQMEYDEAIRRGIDVLVYFLSDDAARWPKKYDERAADPEFEKWVTELKSKHVVREFSDDITTLDVSSSLARWVQEMGPQVSLRLYLDGVQQDHGYIKFVSLPRLEDRPNAPIGSLFVQPAVSKRDIPSDADPRDWPHTDDALNCIASNRAVVILGNPGTGKTTFVSWLSWWFARVALNSGDAPIDALRGYIPLPITLRDLRLSSEIDSLEELLNAFLSQPIARVLTEGSLYRLLKEGRLLFLLDGLDEIGNTNSRRSICRAIWSGMRTYPTCRWVVTSRVVGYHDAPVHERESEPQMQELLGWRSQLIRVAELVFIAPFNDLRIDSFARQWYSHRESSPSRATAGADDFLKAIRADDSTLKLGRIPNLLTMMAQVHRVRARLPHGRALLYNEIAQAYLETIDSFRSIHCRQETTSERKRWLARIGFEMQRRRRTRKRSQGEASRHGGQAESMSHLRGAMRVATRRAEDDVRGVIEGSEILASGRDIRHWIAATYRDIALDESDKDAAEIVDYLARRTGLLHPRGEDQFAFLHLSFQEYFAACFLQQEIASPDWIQDNSEGIIRGASKAEISQYANDPAWRESLVFLVELIAASEQPKWLHPVCGVLFGREFERLESKGIRTTDVAVLLARLAVDPYSGFTVNERERAIAACCRFELDSQGLRSLSPEESAGEVLRTLLSIEIAERSKVSDVLAKLCVEEEVYALNLKDTSCVEVRPFARISRLTELSLAGTDVREIGGLASLKMMTKLFVNCTCVSDIECVIEMTDIRELDLSDTLVASLSALKGCVKITRLGVSATKVQSLNGIEECVGLEVLEIANTRIADLSPLRRLMKLRFIDISGSSVTDVSALKAHKNLKLLRMNESRVEVSQVEALSSQLPKCKIEFSQACETNRKI